MVALGCGAIAITAAGRQPGRFAGRFLRVGLTVLVIGVLTFFAARSVNGGVAGDLLAALFSWIAVTTALAFIRGTWQEARRTGRNPVLGGCLFGIAFCGMSGVLLCFGGGLLLGSIFGGVAAYMNNRRGWVPLQQLIGLDIVPRSQDMPPPAPAPSALDLPAARRAAVGLALVCFVVGISFGALGTLRSLEGVSSVADFGCQAPCGLHHGLWADVLRDGQGNLVSRGESTIQLRVNFRDDAPGERVINSGDFTLTGPDATYSGCGSWTLSFHIDDNTTKQICFTVPSASTIDPGQLVLKWTVHAVDVMIPLGEPYLSVTVG